MMKTGQSLSTNQIHQLALTPELRQSLQFLQMPVMDLATHITELLTDNCVMELNDDPADQDQEQDDFSLPPVMGEQVLSLDADYTDDDESDRKNDPRRDPSANQDPFNEPSWDDSLTLPDHLTFQLHLAKLPPYRTKIGEFLIENIDEDGYLQCDPAETANLFKTCPEEISGVLRIIQSFDPPGVGCRSLSECLRIQLDAGKENWVARYGPEVFTVAARIAEGYLDAIAQGKFNQIAAKLKVSLQTLQQAADCIRKLNPKPGRCFGIPKQTSYIHPDAIIKKTNGQYVIMVEDGILPHLRINPYYQKIMVSGSGDQETLHYIKEKIQAAFWVIKCLEQRKNTIYKIAESIVLREKDFLEKGPVYLQPLTLREIAAATGLHESTVSRAAQGKYLETPQGTFAFKYFFDSKITSDKGSPISAESVKKLIGQAISREDKKNPLSDHQLSDLLKTSGINASRRTVAKYREELAIPASLQRRRFD